jgi:ketosteroid isomerase-like protein
MAAKPIPRDAVRRPEHAGRSCIDSAQLPVPDVEPESKVCPMSRSPSAAFAALWRAYSEGRLAHSLGLLDPGCEVVLPDGRRVRGHDGVRAWLGELHRDWSTLTVVCDEVHEAGPDCVVAVGRVTGTSADGARTVDLPLAGVAEFRRGVLVRAQAFAGREQALRHARERRTDAS